ncbi:hypothetical protein NYE79_05240 [Streptococcus sp. FSL W8-0197]|uniref:Uncharacterized protein n=3 Tax=Bacteria TaxID=2 RepID=A0A1S0Z4B6_SALET|nr:hypothetical protein [Streptococcus oralis]MBU6861904.1 hypothetical protein [Streptococcus oralis]MCM3310783.1 hypothetical protein [Streptococcus oralis]MCY7085889.1 hypothetical protein [Streptococcus oralis]
MSKDRLRKSYKPLFIVLLLATITAGGVFMFRLLGKSQEEHRNREYEVSLVNALKNSYEGIEEIKISNPEYTTPPGDWSCDVNILFSDKVKIEYRVGHSLNDVENYNGFVNGKTNKEINDQWEILNSHKGKTTSLVTIYYSDKEKGVQ